MIDYKNKELARLIARNSLLIKPKSQVYIKYKSEDSLNFIKQLILEISKRGGIAFTTKYNKELEDFLLSTLSVDSINPWLERHEFENKKYDIFISIGSNDEFIKTPKTNQEIIDEYKRKRMELEKYRVHKQSLLLNYPSIVDANNMGMSYDAYYRYAMDAMTYDFSQDMVAILELKKMIAEAKYVRIKGDNVDLEFYKDNIPAVELLGKINLPDGEIYTAPIRDSVNGYIRYNVPSPKNGYVFNEITLRFKDGKVIDYSVKDHWEEFEQIINIDERARYDGELAFGCNPLISKPMCDILYDEKLCRSFHLALGNAYRNAYNGNNSALHWDMIYLNEKGNYCDVFLDKKLVSSGGEFVPTLVKKLNK